MPVTFMLLQPQSWSDEVWTDITRMLTLNGAQSAAGREMHLCPMQFDIADRAITRAKQADGEIAAGKYRGPLHGIPYGVKDLMDTAQIPTTYGAEPFRDRIPTAQIPEESVANPSPRDRPELLHRTGHG